MTDLEDLTNGILNLTITYRRQLLSYNNDTFRSALKSIRDVSRITIACFESDEARRNFLVAIAEAGMDTEEYMWIMIESRKAGFGQQIDVEPLNSTAEFIADVKQKMTEPPYNCNDCTDIDPVRFTGTVIINQNLSRDPVFYVWGLNTSDQEVVLMKITGALSVEGVVISEMQPPSVIWVNHGGSPPLNRPHCGFDGKACPPSFVEQYLAVTLASIAVGLVLIAIIAAAVIYIMRTKRKEQERLNLLWQIPFISLQKPNQKDTTSHSFFTLGNDSIVARKHKVRTLMNKNDCAALRKVKG
ncbi:hypothetical protein ANCCEY_02487 [Ancylostoma ceylanicum]|uniref:Receptor ligand binding region domain-containing protein n=1 Tax=Ancylostoma ceylanicum TaxID=53326 RepID=A0A0D6M7M4_9BILA|nr:hypothetical protein ANCCEY_02487 [Ancylostoma ceylanicum]